MAIGLTITEAIIPIGEQVPNPKRQIGAVTSWAPKEADKSELSFLDKSFSKTAYWFYYDEQGNLKAYAAMTAYLSVPRISIIYSSIKII